MHIKPSSASAHVPPLLHASREQKMTGVSQVGPEKPGGQEHLKSLMSSLQVPPFSHGAPSQSSMSVRQRSPVKPTGHVHANDPSSDPVHVASLEHGDEAHGDILLSHVSPSKPSPHWQENRLAVEMSTRQLPPFEQGLLEHSSKNWQPLPKKLS